MTDQFERAILRPMKADTSKNHAVIASTQLLERYASVRQATLALVAPLSAEDQVVQSMPDASPSKWHLAHTTWFFENFVLVPHLAGYQVQHPRYGYLFNSYYQTVGAMHARAQRGLLSRPGLAEIMQYRKAVDASMAMLLARAEIEPALCDLIELGLQHEQQHQELILTDIKHLLSCNPLAPAYRAAPLARMSAPAPLRWLARDGGLVEMGYDGDGFCFDNERPRHRSWLAPHALAHRPVTNAEYREFVRDGAYTRPELWLSEAWDTVQQQGWTRPLYWGEDSESEFTLYGLQTLDPHAAVCHLSFYEADAYARWAGARLPTEAEWETAARDLAVVGNFVESGRLHPAAASAAAQADVIEQMFGDAWEWTSSPYIAYPGYRVPDGAIGEYNGKFMCNQWVLRGGSCASPQSHLRATYRNFFPATARWQFSGLRLARDLS